MPTSKEAVKTILLLIRTASKSQPPPTANQAHFHPKLAHEERSRTKLSRRKGGKLVTTATALTMGGRLLSPKNFGRKKKSQIVPATIFATQD